MKTIVIDDNAHQILLDWKNRIEEEEEKQKISSNPTHSQAIRWARDQLLIEPKKGKK